MSPETTQCGIAPASKTCRKCGLSKDVLNFRVHRTKQSWLSGQCKPCEYEWQKVWNDQHKDATKASQEKHRTLHRDSIIAKKRQTRLANLDKARADDKKHRLNNLHSVKLSQLKYKSSDMGRGKIQHHDRGRKAREPYKMAARIALHQAIRSRKVVRQPCSICGDPKSHGHHSDYSKPLDVIWLCRSHHAEWHNTNTPLNPLGPPETDTGTFWEMEG